MLGAVGSVLAAAAGFVARRELVRRRPLPNGGIESKYLKVGPL